MSTLTLSKSPTLSLPAPSLPALDLTLLTVLLVVGVDVILWAALWVSWLSGGAV